jgi:hypothetical protein
VMQHIDGRGNRQTRCLFQGDLEQGSQITASLRAQHSRIPNGRGIGLDRFARLIWIMASKRGWEIGAPVHGSTAARDNRMPVGCLFDLLSHRPQQQFLSCVIIFEVTNEFEQDSASSEICTRNLVVSVPRCLLH